MTRLARVGLAALLLAPGMLAQTSPVAHPSDPAPAEQSISAVSAPIPPITPAPPQKKIRPKVATKPTKAPVWASPMPGAVKTSGFGRRWGEAHKGVDLAKPTGTVVSAVHAGRVVAAGRVFSGYGKSVVIRHKIHGHRYYTHYAHLSKTVVKPGQRVHAGQHIGCEGSTGHSTGPHLHFELHKGHMWHQINPAPFLRHRGANLGK